MLCMQHSPDQLRAQDHGCTLNALPAQASLRSTPSEVPTLIGLGYLPQEVPALADLGPTLNPTLTPADLGQALGTTQVPSQLDWAPHNMACIHIHAQLYFCTGGVEHKMMDMWKILHISENSPLPRAGLGAGS